MSDRQWFAGRIGVAVFGVSAFVEGIVNSPAVRADQSTAAAKAKFEVASVKAAVPRPPTDGGAGGRFGGGCPQSMKMDRARVDIECATVATLIGYAFRFSPDRVTGPDWMMGLESPKFDIVAKLPQGAPENQVPEMVQALLADVT